MKIENTEICLKDIRLFARHGVMEQERLTGGAFTVNLRLRLTGADGAVLRDNLSDTVNYAEAYRLVREEMNRPSALIEHVAGRILSAVFEHFPQVAEAEVEVCKDNPPMGADCGGAAVTVRAVR